MLRVLSLMAVAAVTAGLLAGPANAEDGKPKKKGNKVEVLFKKLDTDNDGKLSATEFSKIKDVKAKAKNKAQNKATTSAKKAGKAATKLDARFKKLDTGNDGYLGLDEFKKITELKKQKKAKKSK